MTQPQSMPSARAAHLRWLSRRTAWGELSFVFEGERLARLHLPGGDDAAWREELDRRGVRRLRPAATPSWWAEVSAALEAYFEGGDVDPARLEVPLVAQKHPPFRERVYRALRDIPRGMVVSYAGLAAAAGSEGAARAVGSAMAANDFPLLVPCHRVVAAGGRLGGYSASGGVELKRRLLQLEGAESGEPGPSRG